MVPEWPRVELAKYPFVYKLYIVRETSGRSDGEGEDPAIEFLKLLLPKLDKRRRSNRNNSTLIAEI